METKTKLKTKTLLKAKASLRNSKPKKKSISWYKKEATKYFNRAVKYRDSVLVDGRWVFECITCDDKVLFKDEDGRFYRNAQAGHFMPEIYHNTQYEPENVNGQCGMKCNKLGLGEQVKYARAIDSKYGDGTAEKLEKMARKPRAFTVQELQEIIRTAKEEIKWYEERTPM